MLKLLMVCAFVSITVEMYFNEEHRSIAWIEGTAILVAVLVVSSVGAWNDYKKEEQFIKLSKISEEDNVVTCLRKSQEEIVHYNDIKVGDLIKIKAGMNIPVDGVIVHSSGVQTNEAAMTGESDELKKESIEMCLQRHKEKMEEAEN